MSAFSELLRRLFRRRGYCVGCRYFRQIHGRRYGMCTRGGSLLLEWRGRWPVAHNWPWPWRCGDYTATDEAYARLCRELEANAGDTPPVDSELARVCGSRDPREVFG